jgi:hypothetical protein
MNGGEWFRRTCRIFANVGQIISFCSYGIIVKPGWHSATQTYSSAPFQTRRHASNSAGLI